METIVIHRKIRSRFLPRTHTIRQAARATRSAKAHQTPSTAEEYRYQVMRRNLTNPMFHSHI